MKTVDRTLNRLRDHLGMDIAYISELSETDIFLRAVSAPNLPEPPSLDFTLKRKTGFCHYIATGEIPSIVHDVSNYPIVAGLDMRTDFNIESFIGLPLKRQDGSTYGTMCCIGHQTNKSLNDRDLETVKLFAEFAAEQIDQELEDRKQSGERAQRLQAIWDEKLLRAKFQPIVRLSDMSIKGFEALARFETDPYLPPNAWFAEAALAGRGVELEVEAVRLALVDLHRLPHPYSLNVNVSPACLQSDDLHDLLAGHDPAQIILELTEHDEVEDYATLLKSVEKYKRMGFRIAVDDAGAGYSGLSHIVEIQPDIIKLDLSLTRNVHVDKVRRSLANALVYFAKETKAEIVAEGIETAEEMETLKQLGVDFGQGYFFDRPLEIDDAIERVLGQKVA
ncbi:MAG: EAL domain-containing protein [Litoreibacter sp.]|nr:EAL domain-containing protein [Litoreibacter sp.]MCY4336081.1 EAL domain-containing protein [Litoreibacter sp.]